MLSREPKTVAWLKQKIKHLPDDYPVYFRDDSGNHHPIMEVITNRYDEKVTVTPGDGLGLDLESLLADGKKIMAVKLYREFTGTSLCEAKQYVDGLVERMRGGT